MAFMKVVSPPRVKNELEIVDVISRWENEVLALGARFQETISESLKVAILFSILPKDTQDEVFAKGLVIDDMSYDEVRTLLMRVSHNKQQQVKPTPMDTGMAQKGEDGGGRFIRGPVGD